jgi:hypothetical protein
VYWDLIQLDVDSLIVLQTTLISCTLVLTITVYYLICRLGLGACKGYVRTLQNMETD